MPETVQTDGAMQKHLPTPICEVKKLQYRFNWFPQHSNLDSDYYCRTIIKLHFLLTILAISVYLVSTSIVNKEIKTALYSSFNF